MTFNLNDDRTRRALIAAACQFYGYRPGSGGDVDRNGQVFVGSDYAGTVKSDGRLHFDRRGTAGYTIRVTDAIEQFG